MLLSGLSDMCCFIYVDNVCSVDDDGVSLTECRTGTSTLVDCHAALRTPSLLPQPQGARSERTHSRGKKCDSHPTWMFLGLAVTWGLLDTAKSKLYPPLLQQHKTKHCIRTLSVH